MASQSEMSVYRAVQCDAGKGGDVEGDVGTITVCRPVVRVGWTAEGGAGHRVEYGVAEFGVAAPARASLRMDLRVLFERPGGWGGWVLLSTLDGMVGARFLLEIGRLYVMSDSDEVITLT